MSNYPRAYNDTETRWAKLEGVELPESFQYEEQPYIRATLVDLKLERSSRGLPILTGTVASGTRTSRLFQHTTSQSIVGERLSVVGIWRGEIERGRAVRAYC